MLGSKHRHAPNRPSAEPRIETLENRQLLHGGFFGGGMFGEGGGGLFISSGGSGLFIHAGFGNGGGEDGGGTGSGFGHAINTITFSQAPSTVQTGLNNLAATDRLPAPTSTQTVFLSNVNGVERYSIDIVGTGTNSVLTVNQDGAPVTAPTKSTTTFGAIPSPAASEITAIATALSLTAPTGTTTVNVTTASDGTATYSVRLTSSASTTSARHAHGVVVTVDASGNPVGDQNLPFSVMPSAIQNGLNAHAPSSATALGPASTQKVQVRTFNGVTTYSTVFTVSGTQTKVTVNAAGALTSLPSHTSTTFSAIPAAAQTELQSLATADGFAGTIAGTQSVDAYNEANGTTIYSINIPVSKTGHFGNAFTINVTISVDQNGNPTTLPTDGLADGDFNFFRSGRGRR